MPHLIYPQRSDPSYPGLTPIDTLEIYRFRLALDSLQRTPEGRRELEDFMRQRPGFMDSLAQIEQLMRNP